MDVLRARAYLDILLGMDSRPAPPAAGAAGRAADAGEPVGLPAAGGPVPGGPVPAGFAARLNLTVPLATVLGLADRPGEAGTLGPVDPWLARDLARAAAGNPTTTWCVTVTDEHGHAIGHGCGRPAPKDPRKRRTDQQGPGPPGGHHPPGGHDPPGGGPGGPAGSGSPSPPPARMARRAATAPGGCPPASRGSGTW